MGINSAFWKGKKVLVTGHTGFKGSWLSLWLQQLGAHVIGFSLAPISRPNLFEVANVAEGINSIFGDIRDINAVKQVFFETQPDIVIHMAAQALVRYSYKKPIETYQTNVMGTLHVLEAIRVSNSVQSVVIVTTDKCYENKEWLWPYRENDPVGGHDPYSSSKACVELLVASYRKSFFSDNQTVSIATARAGNVIGGGDWSEDRLIPDIINSFERGETVSIRSPNAIRPWQHVLEPLFGYLLLAEKLYGDAGRDYSEAWNFGPTSEGAQSVQWVVEHIAQHWKGAMWEINEDQQLHEAKILKLDSTKAYEKLGWQTRWTLAETLQNVTAWYLAEQLGVDVKQVCYEQIDLFNKIGCN